VVVSDLPGMTDIVTNDETGLVFRSEKAADLSAALLAMARSPELRGRLAGAALALMKNVYTWDRVGQDTAAVYRQVTQR
jgi:glycosyltransferase involved in cell wall biosynthesis